MADEVDARIAAAYAKFAADSNLATAAQVKEYMATCKGSVEMAVALQRLYQEKLPVEERQHLETELKTLIPALAAADISSYKLKRAADGGIILGGSD